MQLWKIKMKALTWPEFAVDDEIYCTILANEAEKVSKDYSDENNPMLIKLTPKDR